MRQKGTCIYSPAISVLFQNHPDSSPHSWLRIFHKNPSLMIIFHNATGQRKSKPPPSFLAGIPGLKNGFVLQTGIPFPVSVKSRIICLGSSCITTVKVPMPPMASTAFFIKFSMTHSSKYTLQGMGNEFLPVLLSTKYCTLREVGFSGIPKSH